MAKVKRAWTTSGTCTDPRNTQPEQKNVKALQLNYIADRERQISRRKGNKMEELVKILIDNYDFISLEDFQEEAKNNRTNLIDWLQWRADGGKMKNEIVSDGLAEASKRLLELI